MPRPGRAEPGRSTWNMTPDSAGVRLPLNTRAHGHGRADPSDDPSAGPCDRSPSARSPGPGHHPRAGFASDGLGLRFYPSTTHRSTSQPVGRAALAARVADGIRARVTPRLILWQVRPVRGAAREGAPPAGDARVRVPRGTSGRSRERRRRLGRRGARSIACGDTGTDAGNSGLGPPDCGRPTGDGPSPLLGRCVVRRTPTMDGERTPPVPAPETPCPWTACSLPEGTDCSV
jgi:hypothetical protein